MSGNWNIMVIVSDKFLNYLKFSFAIKGVIFNFTKFKQD